MSAEVRFQPKSYEKSQARRNFLELHVKPAGLGSLDSNHYHKIWTNVASDIEKRQERWG